MSPPRSALKPAAGTRLAVVNVGYAHFALPIEKAMSLLKLMEQSVQVTPDYKGSRMTYSIGDAPDLDLVVIRPEQLRAKPTDDLGAASEQPLRLETKR